MTYDISLQTFYTSKKSFINWIFFYFVFALPAAFSQSFESSGQTPMDETLFTFPISGEIVDAFTGRPINGATARFIILPDSTNFQTDHLGHFNGKWTSVEEDIVQNFPNPFNPSTTIQFAAGYDILEIYTILGQLLVRVDVNSQNQIDIEMASGVYIYRLRDNQTGKVAQNKMIALDGGFFTIYLEQIDRSKYRTTNMFNKTNANFDDFAQVKILRQGYAALDTNVRIVEGVRNEFEFALKPFVKFRLNGSIRNNYGNNIENARLILIRNPLNEPDTLFNGVVRHNYSCGTIIRVAKYLDDVMLKLIRYGYDTYIEYITLNPGNNLKDIELLKPLNDYLLTGLIKDNLTGARLNKKLVIFKRNMVQDTISSENGWYQTTIIDTALSLVLNLEVIQDMDHYGTNEKFTVYARKPFMAEHNLNPIRIKYSLQGRINERETEVPVANARIFVIHKQDTLVNTMTNKDGIYDSGIFYWPKPEILSARFEIISEEHDRYMEYVGMKYGKNVLNKSVKP